MQIETNNEVMKSQKMGTNPKGLLDINWFIINKR